MDIFAPLVISDAGFYNTFQSLLPEHLSPFTKILSEAKGVRHGVGAMSVYIGLRGTNKELDLKAHNIWAFTENDIDKIVQDYLKGGADLAGTVDIPLLFISFPSAKDPEWEKRHPGKSTATIITFAPYEWFGHWEDERIMHRGEEYEELKNRLGNRMWEQVCSFSLPPSPYNSPPPPPFSPPAPAPPPPFLPPAPPPPPPLSASSSSSSSSSSIFFYDNDDDNDCYM